MNRDTVSRAAGVVVVLLAATVAAPFVPAQQDRQTEDWEKEDRRYLERLQKREEPEEPQDSGDRRRQLREKIISDAEELIRDRNFDAESTDRIRVLTDDPRLDPGKAAALLDSFRDFFEQFWSARMTLRPYEEKSRFFLFYSFYKYNRLLTGQDRFGDFRPPGHYRRWLDIMVVHTDGLPPEHLADTLIHESTHQQVAKRLLGDDVTIPVWLSEGLAVYFEHTLRDQTGTWWPGRVGDKNATLLTGTRLKKNREPFDRVRRLRSMLKGMEEGWLPRLLRAPNREFYGEGVDWRYTASWLLVRYLLHEGEGAHAERFTNYLKKVAAGESEPEVFYSTLETGPSELEEALTAYVKRFKAD